MLSRFAAMGGVAAAATTPAFVSSSIASTGGNAASVTVPSPSGIQNGDLLVAISAESTTLSGAVTPPSGFSRIRSDPGTSGGKTTISVKVANNESGNYVFTHDGTGTLVVAILVYRNATRVNTVGVVSKSTVTGVSASSITPSYSGLLLAVFANSSSTAVVTPPSGMTQRVLGVYASGAGSTLAVYEQPQAGGVASGAKILTWSASGSSPAQFLLQITNEPSVKPQFVGATQAQTSNSATVTVNKPTETIAGDLMVAVMSYGSTTSRTWTSPAGWTEVADQGGVPSVSIAYKVATASEPSSYNFTASSSSTSALAATILTYRNADYDVTGGFTTSKSSTATGAQISPTNSQALLLAIAAINRANSTFATPITMTARSVEADSTAPSFGVFEQDVAAGPCGLRVSVASGSGSEDTVGIMVAIKPTTPLT